MMYFLKSVLVHSGAWFRQTSKCIVMITKKGLTKTVNFMIPWVYVLVRGRGHLSKTVKMHLFLKNPLFYTQAKIRKTKYILVMMIREASTEIVNFMTPGVGVLVLRRGHTNHILKMHYFLKNLHLCFSQAWIRQIKCIVIMIKEEILKFKCRTPKAEGLGTGGGQEGEGLYYI